MVNNKINYNEKYILIVKDKEDYKKFNYSFKNILILKNGTKELKNTLKFIKSNNFKQIIFVDYESIFVQLINSFEKEYIIKFIFTKDLGTLSNVETYQLFSNIYDLYEEKKIDEIGFLDKHFYDSFKDKIKCSYLLLDRKREEELVFHDNTISVINDSKNLYSSFYNELSAIKLANKTLKTKKIDKRTKRFIKLFKIDHTKTKNKYEKSIVGLYVNFSDNDNLKILESFDNDIPCILGNSNIFENNVYLQNKLVLKSDDDIDEIKEKIEDVINCREKIINEYKKFRKEYTANSKKSIMSFTLETEEKEEKKYEYLISVIIPVFNSEDTIENTIKSILKARIKDMEIIFVNDGSKDNTEAIIMKYKEKYPKLIKYFSKKNEGPGSARNLGLKNAKGKYISSVDSDDQIDKNFYKKAIKYLNDDIDMVIYDWKTYDKDMNYITPAIEPAFSNKEGFEGILYTTIMPSQCNKIIKRSIYDELKLTYGPGKYEDFDTNSIALLAVKKYKYIKKPYYHYYIRQGSIMRSEAKLDMIDAIKLLDERLDKYKDYLTVNLDEYKYYLYSWRIEEYVINDLYELDEKERNKKIDYMIKKIKDIMIDIFESDYYKEVLNKLSEEKKEYLIERNKSIKSEKLKNFISKKIKDKSYQKLTAMEILYM